MKALIVDDEAHVITAVKLLVPWADFGIMELLEASTPQDAIRLLEQEQPEILITDIVMQDLSGIDLMEYITNSPIRTKVVVISGYDNFEYVRSSLRNGGVDYILKPLDQRQLTAAVRKAVDAWNQEQSLLHTVQTHQDQIHSMTSLVRENLLSKMLAGQEFDQSYRELLQICPELGEQTSFGFACCSLSPFLSDHSADQKDDCSRFREALSEFLSQNSAGFLVPSNNAGEILLFFSSLPSGITKKLEDLLSALDGRFSFPTAMGFSSSSSFPNRLTDTLEEARASYGFLNAVTLRPFLCSLTSLPPTVSRTPLPPRSEAEDRRLLSALLTGNESMINKAIESWLNSRFQTSSPCLSHVLSVIEEEHQLFSGWVSLFKRRHKGFSHQEDYRLLRYPDISDSGMHLSMTRFRQRIHMDIFFLYQELKNIRSPESDMIYQVAHYIELNYDQPFSQFACAQMFFVNKDYLCRKFKQTFHKTMITYLNELRIRQAEHLLEDPAILVRQIAHDVGFEDEKYFSRQFKKITGMTPGDYRILHLQKIGF